MVNKSMTREEWLEKRRQFICSTDVSAILNENPWKTPLHIYMEKVEGFTEPPSESAKIGLLLEASIAAMYSESTGAQLVRSGHVLRVSSVHPHLATSLDYTTEDGRKIVEIKSSRDSGAWGRPGTEEVPRYVYIQVQHQMAVVGITEADVAVLVSGHELKIFHIKYNKTFFLETMPILNAFWERVQKKEPPEMNYNHPATKSLARHLHGCKANVSQVFAVRGDLLKMAERYIHLQGRMRLDEKEMSQIYSTILDSMNGVDVASVGNDIYIEVKKVKSPKGGDYLRMKIARRTRKK